MDPFVEQYEWQSFHVMAIVEMQRMLIPQLPEGYIMAPESVTFARDLTIGEKKNYRPDVAINSEPQPSSVINEPVGDYGVATPPTAVLHSPKPKHRTLIIREAGSRELVTAIEFLSPSNKRGADAKAYYDKRNYYIANGVNLLEIDFLRKGKRPDYSSTWPKSTYYIQLVEAYADTTSLWNINIDDQLPTVTVPLLLEDDSLLLNMQKVIDEVFTYSTYHRMIDYQNAKVKPPFSPEEKKVVDNILAN
jgi:hypothetical protein